MTAAAAKGTMLRIERPATRWVFAALSVLLAAAAILSLAIGATGTLSLAAWKALVTGQPADLAANASMIVTGIRLPRTLLAILVGSALAVSGVMMQGMFRNPLADPGLIGVSSGAALAAVLVIAFGHGAAAPLVDALGAHALPLAAFTGGMFVTTLLVSLSGGARPISTAGLLLAGLAIGALAQACMGLAAYLSDDRALRDLTLWTLGSLSGASWAKVFAMLPFALLAGLALPWLVRGLNALLLGEAEAFHLGIDVLRTKYAIVFVTAALVGSAVAVAGIIGFVGIIVPHIARQIVGPSHDVLLPASALLGAALTLTADITARTIVAPAELPIGIVMAVLGAPFFLHLVLHRAADV
jgi:iron complex transport system permease protein